MKRFGWAGIGVFAVTAALLLALAAPALAQGGLQLSLRKDYGSGIGNQIQGRWTVAVRGAEGITSVTYELDGTPMATVTQAPYSLTFDTGQYPTGVHRLSATAQTAAGGLRSNEVTVEFVTAGAAARVALPIIGLALALVLVASVIPQLLVGRKKRRFEPGMKLDYGLTGGAICPKCRRPFVYSFLGPNLLVGKLLRCPYCGHWAILRRASPAALAAAEAEAGAGAAPAAKPAPLSPEEKFRRQIEDSKYQD